MAPFIWLIIAVLLAVAEMFALSFVLIMLAAGALAAAGAAALGADPVLQVAVFSVVSAFSLFVLRPIARRMMNDRSGPDADIGLAALEGSPALVLERVDDRQGVVKIGGEEWSARVYEDGQVLEAGERVHVVEIRGATAMVWRQQ
ncbi:membrane protein [Actinorhabdospora filicis]|uniref:Membrane protein n=1 Tax=Actinorhabdospora filicis TaxID=1785913 RepID=A0A9W6SQ99_9ACTN|nr:NfeD family protein [Actinorhabdospora filicis]GLZ78776.1 membrane protein [Actinorhabdospora filicis]